jgi:RHS repeat-associated protein
MQITFPDGSDYIYQNTTSTEEEESGESTGPSYWVSSAGVKSYLSQDGNQYILYHEDGSICYFETNVQGDQGQVGGEAQQVSYRLSAIHDSIGNLYTLQSTSSGGLKITDSSGRWLEIIYSNALAHLARQSRSYAFVPGSPSDITLDYKRSFPAQFLVLNVKNTDASLAPIHVMELEFYDKQGALITGTPFGASPYYSANHAPAHAFDGSPYTGYLHSVSTAGYVGIDCGVPKRVARIRYNAINASTFEIVGLSTLNSNHSVISQVTSSDGRTVNYTYSTVTDPTGWFNWSVLSGVHYSDGTSAAYTYAQTASFSRPLMTHCRDPRILGNGTEIEYTYDSSGALGFIKEERSGITGEVIAATAHDGAQQPKAIYPSGRSVAYGYSPTTARIMTRQDGLGNITHFTHDEYGFLASETDPLGRTTTYWNDFMGRPLMVTYPDDTVSTRTYDSRGRLLTSALSGPNFATRNTTYTRDTAGRVTQITYPDATTESWTYNSYGKPLTHTQKNGAVENFSYDSSGRLLTHTDALGAVTSYTYDALDRVASITDPLGRTQSFEYNDRGKVTKQTHADGTFSEFDYDDFDNLIGQVNELGQFWTTTYDEFRNPLIKTDPLGRATTYSYGENSPSACGACRSSGKPTAITSPSGRQVRCTYDLEWRLTSQTVAFGTADQAVTQYAHDAVGNVTLITDPSGSSTSRAYDSRDRVTSSKDALNRTTTTAYDRASNVIYEVRPDNGATFHNYDLMSRLTSTMDAKQQTTTFGYDVEGNRITLTDARNHTYSWGYDALNRPTIMTYPDGSHENWTYDAASQRLTARARNGAVATSTFDLRGRELTVDWNDSTPDITRTFDAAGHLLSSSNGLSTSSYTYDIAGQQLTETQHLHGIAPALPAYTVGYTWDADGRNATLSYPGGTVVSRTYTARGQVETISEGAPPPLVSYTYNPVGTRASKSLENGTVTTYSYDVAHQVTALGHFHGSTPLQTRGYQYNSVGNRTAMQVDGGTWDVYGFDAVDQITSAKYQASSSSGVTPQRTVSYTWDPVGNRQQVNDYTASGSTNTTVVYATANSINQYPAINGHQVTHDANGNLTAARLQNASTGPVAALGYDSSNRLLSVQNGSDNVTSTYDTRNRVTSRTINGITTLFLWDDWNLIEERDMAGNQLRRYVHGAAVDEILIMVDASGAKYHHHDALGSVTALTDSSGAILETYKYDVFGTASVYDSSFTLHPSSLFGNRFLYTGREWIAEASLYDYRNRVFSPVIGRFMQTDPIRFDAGDVNVYRYVGNGVLNWNDPSGLMLPVVAGLVGGVVGGIIGFGLAVATGQSGAEMLTGALSGFVGGVVGGATGNIAAGAAVAGAISGGLGAASQGGGAGSIATGVGVGAGLGYLGGIAASGIAPLGPFAIGAADAGIGYVSGGLASALGELFGIADRATSECP